MHLDMIVLAKRYTSKDLLPLGVVERTAPSESMDEVSMALAKELSAKGKNALYRRTMEGIKRNVFEEAYRLLTSDNIEGMGFENKPAGVDRAPKVPSKL